MSKVALGSVWREKSDKRKIATVVGLSKSKTAYPVELSVSYRRHKLHTGFSHMGETFNCTESYVVNLHDFVSDGEL